MAATITCTNRMAAPARKLVGDRRQAAISRRWLEEAPVTAARSTGLPAPKARVEQDGTDVRHQIGADIDGRGDQDELRHPDKGQQGDGRRAE